jgi:hypothetical protein
MSEEKYPIFDKICVIFYDKILENVNCEEINSVIKDP